jgi:hypothetical protein
MKPLRSLLFQLRTRAIYCCVIGALSLATFARAETDPVLGAWSWGKTTFRLEADGRAIQKGRKGSWHSVSSVPGEHKIQINWDNGRFLDTLTLDPAGMELRGQNQVNYPLRATRIGAAPAMAAVPAAPSLALSAPVTPPQSCIDRFANQLPQAAEWTLAPLEIKVPSGVGETIVALGAGLRDENTRGPQASRESYQAALNLCQLLVNELAQRDVLLRKNAQLNNNGGLNDAWKKSWNERVFAVGPKLEAAYAEFQAAVGSSPAPSVGVPVDCRLTYSLPALPDPSAPKLAKAGKASRPAPAPKVVAQARPGSPAKEGGTGLQMNNGGLNRTAYDQRYIWTWRSSRWIY